ncbi:MAG: hypothetical protein Q4B78_04835 [Bacillota bacterium]|nr:hypothetical protein [Bacillota bacterium]
MIQKITNIIQLAIGVAVVLLGLLVLTGVLDIAPKSRTPILFIIGGLIIAWAVRTIKRTW